MYVCMYVLISAKFTGTFAIGWSDTRADYVTRGLDAHMNSLEKGWCLSGPLRGSPYAQLRFGGGSAAFSGAALS